MDGKYRPPIWVRVLPALENIFYGANLSNVLSAHKSTLLDVLAWLPYGITHFGAPAVCTLVIFIFAPPKSAPLFARAYGYMNLVGVTIQLLFPCSPPGTRISMGWRRRTTQCQDPLLGSLLSTSSSA